MFNLLPFLALGAYAASIPASSTSSCTFVLTAVGESIKAESIGRNRIGGTATPGAYHISNNKLYDAHNHYCGISPTSHQLRCQKGSFGSTNITVAEQGHLLHEGSDNWVACPAKGSGADGSYKIFSDAKALNPGCEAVTIRSEGMCSNVVTTASGTMAAQASPAAIPAPYANTSGTCPTNLNGTPFQFPHLIVPTSPNDTTHAFGNSQKAYISPINTTLFNFDVPATAPYNGTCALLFLFPFASDLAPSAGKYYFSGLEEEEGENGGLDFALLDGVADNCTTYATTPAVATDYGKTTIVPGNNYTIATFPCPAGKAITVSGSSRGNVELDYFQDSGVQPIGLYLVPCA